MRANVEDTFEAPCRGHRNLNAYPEQRRYLRYQIFDYTSVFVPEQSEPLAAMLVDIGLGGAQLRSKVALPDGATIKMRIGNFDGSPIDLAGEVRHCCRVPDSELYGTGVRFAPSNHEERVALAEFVHGVFQRQRERLVN
jgi:c-di-GMP-binding flagellar brake protein YcgR